MTDREAAKLILSPRQYEAWNLRDRGMSQRNIALAMNLTRSGVIYLLEAAAKNLANAADAARIEAERKDTAA